ncbi:uncharacterized protein LOC127850969 [Dreissena polymorpha]|uniref:Uncharacterized protein n=1 Tax=Dreissena polymorpha TaxID=45954 RepID=A0A9D4HVA9_DREPO|nr:uncharacterized protein LOC127850969 [Dreissena polymorpha]KAH3736540.1 hypothetical protein DPMN_043111 [Dreissena polymorpha]
MRGRGRGRGRGGRGRGGRGRGSSRGRGGRNTRSQSKPREETTTTPKELNIETDVTSYFVGNVSADQHYEGQQQNRDRYAAAMAVLQNNGVDIVQNARIRALAAAWARHDYELANAFLQNKDNFGLLEVLKAVTLLDSGRQIRVLEKKMKRLQTSAGKVKPTTIGKLKSDIDNLNKHKPLHGTASGAICKHVRSWVKHFTKDELEFYALHFPKDPWTKLADICHFHPKQDFPALDWFLEYCYGGPAPEGSMVQRCCNVTAENVNSLIQEFPIPYTHVKLHLTALTNESKARIASYEKKLDTVIWWYDELKCTEVDEVITRRVQAGEEITLPNGKLLERLLAIKMYREGLQQNSYGYGENGKERKPDETKAPFFKELLPLGQKKMDAISLSLESPIVVIGDASGSMQVAIRTSSIIAGLLTAICQAQLVFFNTENIVPPYVPKNIEEVLNLAVEMQAGGGTTPAASLWPFYEKKEVVKTFIIVTDEEENGQSHGDNFNGLYQKYHDEVYPAKLVFVSFFHNQNSRGDMVPKLEANGHKPMRFIFDFARPDLTKLDKMFGMLVSGTTNFDDEIRQVQLDIKSGRLAKVFEKMEI